jgi:hypothetical protein
MEELGGRGEQMPTLVSQSSGSGFGIAPSDGRPVTRILEAAYARERLEDVIRAVAEDALNPGRDDSLPWRDEAAFGDDLDRAINDIAAAANLLLAERLTDLIESAPPRVAGRLASVPRWPEQA